VKEASATQLVHLLLQLQRQRQTGVLSVHAQQVHTLVYFKGGRAVFADEGTLGETLGRVLVDRGRITQEQYAHAIEVMKTQLEANSSMRMGELLVHLGLITVADVQDALVAQMGRRISRLMQFESVQWEFDPSAERTREVPVYPVRAEPWILDGIRRYYDRDRMGMVLAGYWSGYVMLRAPIELITRCFSLSRDGTRLLATFDGTQTLHVWLGQQQDQAWWRGTSLALAGVLDVSVTPPSTRSLERAVGENPSLSAPGRTGQFQIPEVRTGAGLEGPPLDGDQAPTSANRERLERIQAESALQRGIESLNKNEFGSAAADFELAMRAMPNVAEYELYEGWARLRSDGALNAAALAELEPLARNAAMQDSQHAFPSYVLGQVAQARGDEDTALRYLRVAAHRDPANKDCALQLKKLSRRKK